MSSLQVPTVLSEKSDEHRRSEQESQPFQICDWNCCLPYLTRLAATGFNQQLRAKLDPSDIVQQTLLQAHKTQALFRGKTEGECSRRGEQE